MKFTRRLLSTVLLGFFLLLVVPKSWLHDCDREFSHFHFSKGISKAEKPCAICDLHVSPFTGAQNPVFYFAPNKNETPYFFHRSRFEQSAELLLLLRGPPYGLVL